MISIKARIKALEAQLHTGHPTPYEDLDPISKSIVDLARELYGLDTAEKREAYGAKNGLTPEQLDECIHSITVAY
ncbi:MAG: hypothetical protein HFF58_07275 [Lawsonibacter sp.]|nr:hypothetical protein [Oscillospiraceae bacterium]MCI9353034.1 hypothetical protein [Lawsonibacter sp.]